MIAKTSLGLFKFIFNISEEKNIIKLVTDTFDEFAYTERKDEIEEILGFSDTSPKHLQHEKIGPRNIKAYKKICIRK